MITNAILKVSNGEDLSFEEAKESILQIASGNATNAQIAAFLTAMKIKGESSQEITAFAQVMRQKSLEVKLDGEDFIDIVGTGGDCLDTFNISTVTIFVVAAARCAVAKHGSRSASGKTGSADFLESLGVNINLNSNEEEAVFKESSMCYMFAQNHHPAMKHVASIRKEIKIRTIFNILGPLLNPAKAPILMLGVFSKDLVEKMANVLKNLGMKKAIILHGEDGLDEASISGKTYVAQLDNGEITRYTITPEDFGLKTAPIREIQTKDISENLQVAKEILSGKYMGAKTDIVALNAGIAIFASGKTSTIKEGVDLAKNILLSGKANEKLFQFIELTNKFKTK